MPINYTCLTNTLPIQFLKKSCRSTASATAKLICFQVLVAFIPLRIYSTTCTHLISFYAFAIRCFKYLGHFLVEHCALPRTGIHPGDPGRWHHSGTGWTRIHSADPHSSCPCNPRGTDSDVCSQHSGNDQSAGTTDLW